MRKVACAVLVIAVLACGLCLLENVQAATPVIGIIKVDTTWTKAGSPYQLTGPTAVGQGVTLTIEPGASVDLGDYYLEVNGTLHAKGTSSENVVISATTKMGTYANQKILFSDPSTDYNEQTGTGSIIENAVLNCVSITFKDASPKISNNHFRDTSYNILLMVKGGAPIITNNEMVFNGDGFQCADGSPTFSGNTLAGNGGQGSWGIRANSITIRNNIFTNLSVAIYAAGPNGENSFSSLTIIGNTITNCDSGVSTQFCPATVIGNSITYCKFVGILCGGKITNNLIAYNGYGIQETPDNTTINYNNIYGNTKSNVYTSGSRDVDATNNYWGTTNETEISQSIHDKKYDYNLGTVSFKPFLTSPAEISYVEPTPHPTVQPTPIVTSTLTPQPSVPTQTPDENGFLIQSNSTISAFSFDSSIPQVSFIVSGPEGTSGYVRLTIAKTFMPNSNMMVYLDGTQIQYNLASNQNSWIITFEYHHSTHQVIVNSAQSSETGLPSWILTVSALIIVVLVVASVCIIVFFARHKQRIDSA